MQLSYPLKSNSQLVIQERYTSLLNLFTLLFLCFLASFPLISACSFYYSCAVMIPIQSYVCTSSNMHQFVQNHCLSSAYDQVRVSCVNATSFSNSLLNGVRLQFLVTIE